MLFNSSLNETIIQCNSWRCAVLMVTKFWIRHYFPVIMYTKFFSGVWRLVAYQVVIDISEKRISCIFYSENTESMLLLMFPNHYALHCVVTHCNAKFYSREKKNKRVASNVPIVEIDVTTKNEWEGPRELVRPWCSGVGSAVHCSGVTSDNGPAVTSRNCVLDPRKNETLDVVTSKLLLYVVVCNTEHNRE